jgi:hypothetical protein
LQKETLMSEISYNNFKSEIKTCGIDKKIVQLKIKFENYYEHTGLDFLKKY